MGGCLAKDSAAKTANKEEPKEVANDIPYEAAPEKKKETKEPASSGLRLDEDEEAVINEPIEDYYELGKEIGRGGFSIVVEATKKGTNEKFAVKCIKKTMVEGDDIKLLRREIQIMKRVSHPNILKLYEVFEDEDEFFLVMELYVLNFLCTFYFFLNNN
jgi:serine/threonine protein kinase